ncbi:MAG: hypothetical protein MJ252_10670, partial [archaeon]|nr:hypothetical protein [archaeon]
MSNKGKCINSFNEYYYKEFGKLCLECRGKGKKNMAIIYSKVQTSIAKYPLPILSSAQAAKLDGIGESIAKTFDNIIEKYKKKIKEEDIDYMKLAFQINEKGKGKTKKGKGKTKGGKKGKKKKKKNNEDEDMSNDLSSESSESLSLDDKENLQSVKGFKGNCSSQKLNHGPLALSKGNNPFAKKTKGTKKGKSKVNPDAIIKEIKEKKNLIDIPTFSSLWCTIISSYILSCRDQNNQITKEDIFTMTNTLHEQLVSSQINLEESKEEDFEEMKNLKLIDASNKKTITINDFTKTFAMIEMRKIGFSLKEKKSQKVFDFEESSEKDDQTEVSNKNMIGFEFTQNDFKRFMGQQGNLCHSEAMGEYYEGNQQDDDLSLQRMISSNSTAENAKEDKHSLITEIQNLFNGNLNPTKGGENLKLIVDNREKGENSENFKIEILNRVSQGSKIKIEERNLSLGDFLWIYEDPETEEEYVVDYIIERKTMNDLAKSIIDGRYTEQKCRLKNSSFTNVFYLFEGNTLSNYFGQNNMSKGAITTAIYNTTNIHDIGIIKTNSTQETISKLIEIDEFLRTDFTLIKNKETNQNMTYEEFTEQCAKSKNATIEQIFVKQLRCFDNCGVKTVDEINQFFKTPLDLFKYVQACKEGGVTKDQMEKFFITMNYLSTEGLDTSKETLVEYLKSNEKMTKVKKAKTKSKVRHNTLESLFEFFGFSEDNSANNYGVKKDDIIKERVGEEDSSFIG